MAVQMNDCEVTYILFRWPDKDIELVLAIGAGKAPNIDLPDNGGAWLKTFVSFATDGDKVWENQVLPTLATDDVSWGYKGPLYALTDDEEGPQG